MQRLLARFARDQRGETLAEMIVTIAILGIAIVAIVGAMGTMVIATDVRSKQARAEATLRSWSDAMNSNSVAYVNCATTSTSGYSATGAGVTLPSGMSASITAVTYWNGTSTNPATFTSTCPSTDAGLQQLTLQVASTDGRVAKTATIVKRKT